MDRLGVLWRVWESSEAFRNDLECFGEFWRAWEHLEEFWSISESFGGFT